MERRLRLTIQSYNRIAPAYARLNKVSTFWKNEFSLFTRCLRGRTVLEIGCGGGRDAALFLREKYRYLGIDASRGLLKVAKQKNPGGTFRQMDIFRMTFPTGSFDGVWTMATLLHVPKRRVAKVLRSVHSLLQPAGVLAVSVKEKKGVDEAFIEQDKYGGVGRFFAFFTKTEFTNILHSAGFRIIRSWRKQEDSNTWLSFVARRD